MILGYGLLLLALLGRVEPFKISLKPPSNQPEGYHSAPLFLPPLPVPAQFYPSQQTYYQPPPQQQPIEIEKEQAPTGVKGAPQPEQTPIQRQPVSFYQPAQPQALAYLIIRPIQPQYQYLEPTRYQPLASQQPIPQEPEQPIQQQQSTKGGEPQQPIQQQQEQQTKGGQPEAPPAASGYQHHHQQEGQQDLLASVVAKKQSKFNKLKSSLAGFAASAKSKLTLGSSYQVISEEIVPAPAPQQPPQQPEHQQQQHQQHEIELTKQEQESIKEVEQQEQLKIQQEKDFAPPQQQPFEQQQQQKEQASKGNELPKQQQQQEELSSFGQSSGDFRRELTTSRITSQHLAAAKTEAERSGSPKSRAL